MDHEMIPFLYSFLFRLEEKDHDIIAYNWRIQKKTSSDLHRIALFRRMFTEKLWNMCQEVKGIEHRYVRTLGCGSSSSQGRCSKLSHDLAVFEAFLDFLVLVPWNICVVQFNLFALLDTRFRHRNICTSECGSSSQGRCSKLSHDLINVWGLPRVLVLIPLNIWNQENTYDSDWFH